MLDKKYILFVFSKNFQIGVDLIERTSGIQNIHLWD